MSQSKRLSASTVLAVAWGSTALAVGLSVAVWGQSLNWDVSKITNYSLFPLFGLLAYGLMISHYLAAMVRQFAGYPAELTKRYFAFTSFAVLACLLLHPGLLVYQQWVSGNGLPPSSYSSYVGAALAGWVTLGTACWLAFIAYEFRFKFGKAKWWKYVQYASDLAMIGIFFHGLKLGSHIESTWFLPVWYAYGVILVTSFLYFYWPHKK